MLSLSLSVSWGKLTNSGRCGWQPDCGLSEIVVWNDDGVDDDIQPPALHKAEVLRLSLVSKVQPHAIMALAWLSTLVALLDALPNPEGCTLRR